jgi:predicted XRE-type DNA-binding protein
MICYEEAHWKRLMTIQEMLTYLAVRGFSQKAIADKVGSTQPTIHRASKGAGISYETGKAIECLYVREKAAADLKSAA